MSRRWDDVLCFVVFLLFMTGLGWALLLGYTGGY